MGPAPDASRIEVIISLLIESKQFGIIPDKWDWR